MGRRAFLGALVVVLLAAVGYAGWRLVEQRDQRLCHACQRPIHPVAATTARVDGKIAHFCCPACALSEHRQSARRIDITSLTDYPTALRLSPANAYLVRGSDAHPCTHGQTTRGEYDRPLQVTFDRCWPSLVAFASRARAVAFARQHGGDVLAFADVADLYREDTSLDPNR